MEKEAFDAIVIGSGQGGNPLAKAMAEAGWKTAMIERKDVGEPVQMSVAPQPKRWLRARA